MRKTSRTEILRAFTVPHGGALRGIDTARYRTLLRTEDASVWEDAGARKALDLFHRMASKVPAYTDFLRKHAVRPNSIATIQDFAKIPPTTKENYIKKYTLQERSWNGNLDSNTICAASSGTSGPPTIWPRGKAQEHEAAFIHDFLFTDLFSVGRKRTLIIIGFPMGIYVSGIATAFPTIVSLFKRPGSAVATVGNNKESFLTVVKNMQSAFDQMILVGHPFFIKDVIETGKREGVVWTRAEVRTLFCSEGFSEEWRTYLAKQVRGGSPTHFLNTYGSSEFLLVGFENPHTVALRRLASADDALCEMLFGTTIVPSLFQYNPLMRYIESDGTDLLLTAHSGIPLARFNQRDAGGVLSFSTVQKILPAFLQKEISSELKKNRFKPWRLPFVTLYNRSDRTLKFYAANIYPEHIMQALNHRAFLKMLTGKFVMQKKYLKNMDEFLELHIELQHGVRKNSNLARMIQSCVVETLERINMEYVFLRKNLAKDLVPRIDLRLYQDAEYFKPGLKPRFIVQ